MDGGGGESSTSTKSKASGGGGAAAAAIEDDILLAAEAHCYDEQQEKDCNGERSEDIFFAHLTHTPRASRSSTFECCFCLVNKTTECMRGARVCLHKEMITLNFKVALRG